MPTTATGTLSDSFSDALKSSVQIRLLKGPIYRAKHRELWSCLEQQQFNIRAYFQQIGLSVSIDDSEGYAFLRQQQLQEDAPVELPRLITRRSLSFGQTLLLVLLRKRLAEHDSEDSSPRLMIAKSEIIQWLQPFFSEQNNEVKQQNQFAAIIKKVIDMGFLTALPNHQDEFEVQRIIKAMISAEQIGQMLEQLQQHSQQEQP